MTTQAHEHDVGPGETLIADVSLAQVPFGWTAEVPAGTEIEYRGSISEDAENWIEPARNGSIDGDVDDYELDPLRWMRFRHVSGSGAATIRIGCVGRVYFEVSS